MGEPETIRGEFDPETPPAEAYEAPELASQRPRSPFPLVPIGELELKPPRWLVRGLIEADALAVLFSEPNAGKSFLAIDIAASVATFSDFHAHAVAPGPVIYLAGESHNSIRRRIEAWQIRHQRTIPDHMLFVSAGPASLCDEANAFHVAQAVGEVADQHGPPALIVIDTLARNMGGDENSTGDMNRFVQAVDAVRIRHKATALIVHHVGHQNKERARGSIALTGAADAEYRLEKDLADNTIRLYPTKMRDAAFPDPLAFKLNGVELGIEDEDGHPVTSAVLDSTGYTSPSKRQPRAGGRNQEKALAVLQDLYRAGRERLEGSGFDPDQVRVEVRHWREACGDEGLDRRRFPEARDALADRGAVRMEHPFVYPVALPADNQ